MTGRAPTSSSIQYQWAYDVFISFRGEDTRYGFTGNLYHALKKAGIRVFIDDEELKKGDEITPTLLKAIENSRMAIIVFSKNYASSTFCLNELVKIHQCIKGMDRKVWPIFYDVEPSEVRHQTGDYKQALTMHKINCKADDEKIRSWKHALQEVADVSGSHCKPSHGYEYQFIEVIVKEISRKINRPPLQVAKYPVGLDSRVRKINSLLEIGSNEKVDMVGIYGSGGMGKTTIARAVYNAIADNFEDLCFLHDVKETSRQLGLNQMQERLLSKILGEDIKVVDVNEGIGIIKLRLKQKKILLILDNVERYEELEKLAGDCNWFGPGSRIIITTKDKHLLVRHGVERKYKMEAFNAEESLELLSWSAFGNNHVNFIYMEVLNHAIYYANGLPLALEVIGSNLYGMGISEWKSALDMYKRSPIEDIQKVLKVSYDGLQKVEKEIFLDIACFFKGRNLKYVKNMVKHLYDFDPSYVMQVLEDKCLIKIENNCIEMHDLMQELGREIVHQESPEEAGKRSRLWFHEDIVHVLEENTGTEKVSIIIEDNFSESIGVNWDGEAFKKMNNLKILIFENMKFFESPKCLPNSLKVLKWQGYPSSCLPPRFCPKKLLVCKLTHSHLNSLETIKKLVNLSELNLGGCQDITLIPDLSNLQHLKKLKLQNCEELIEIHDSVGYLRNLEVLDVSCCVKLKIFPRYLKLPSLGELDLFYCSSLTYFPEILEEMKIQNLHLCGTGIEKLPWSICNLTHLTRLEIGKHRGVIRLPKSIFLLPEISVIKAKSCEEWLPSNLKEAEEQAILSKKCEKGFTISLKGCNISNELLQTYMAQFTTVRNLDFSGNNFTILPAWIKECQFLYCLDLNGCKHLREVEGIPPKIKILVAINCISLSSKSRSLLLSEELLGSNIRRTMFCVPTTSIPDWFHHSSKGSEISFWYRENLPPLLLFCALIKPKDGFLELNDRNPYMSTVVYINNKKVEVSSTALFDAPNVDHIAVYNLVPYLSEDEEVKLAGQKWKHVRVCVNLLGNDSLVIEERGIYVGKQYEMGDIQFTDPYQFPDYETADDEDDMNSNYTCSDDHHSAETKFWESSSDDEGNSSQSSGDGEEGTGRGQFGRRMKDKEPMTNKKRQFAVDDNFASSSIAFRSTKRARNCSTNLDDNNANTTEIQSADASETIGNQEAIYLETNVHENDTSVPMLSWTEHVGDIFSNQALE